MLLACVLVGCGEVHPRPPFEDGGMDASAMDASVMDASAIDASAMDASVMDASDASAMDAGRDARVDPRMDAGSPIGTPCSVSGVPGTCELVSTCAGMSTPGFCPGPRDVQCCTARIDAGPGCDPSVRRFPNEGLVEAPGDPGCPSGMLRVGTFCIDRYEASLVRVDDGTSLSPFHNPGTTRARAVSIAGAIPQGYINGRQAAAACMEAGKRLCTDTEWLRACRGPSSTTYPYGNTRMPGVCNDARAVHPAVERFGTSADWIWSRLGDACINQLPDSLAPTGAHPGCVSAEGPFDMMGNLHEWTADPAGTFRGGFYVDTYRNGEGCLYRTTAHDVGHWDYSTGFRCCADPR
jgi:hypothetical protein